MLTSVLSAEYYLLEPLISSRLNFLNKAMLINWKKSFLNPSKKKKERDKDRHWYQEETFEEKHSILSYCVKLIQVAMDVINKHGKDEFYIVMDYCKTHHTAFVIEAIKNRGYKS